MDPPDPAHMAIVRTGEDWNSTSGLNPSWTDCAHEAGWVGEKQQIKSSWEREQELETHGGLDADATLLCVPARPWESLPLA